MFDSVESAISFLEQKVKYHERMMNACTHIPIQREGHRVSMGAYQDGLNILRGKYKNGDVTSAGK